MRLQPFADNPGSRRFHAADPQPPADEDDSYWAELSIDIGDTNIPITPSDEPEIISAVAVILGNGDATLTIDAVDSYGSPNVSYEWDLDGDGVFEVSGPATVQLAPSADFYPFSATVKITDSVGRSTEAMYNFVQAGNPPREPTVNTYRADFRKETPDLPLGWKIHHTKQQGDGILAARYLKEQGINVHKTIHLRGVPDNVHNDITQAQIAWWKQKAKEFTPPVTPTQAKHLVPLAEVDAFDALVEAAYNDRWVQSGASAQDITKVKNLVQNGAVAFGMSKASRWQSLAAR